MIRPLFSCVSRCFLLLTLLAASSSTASGQARMSPELLWKLGRVGGGVVSADGSKVAFTVRRYVLAENSGTSSIFLIDGNRPARQIANFEVRIITSVGGGRARRSAVLIGAKTDAEKPTPQVWALNPTDGKLTQVTSLDSGVANLKLSPDGKHLAFTVDVKMDATVNELYKDLPKADARIIDGLMYRHWNAWHDYAYSHLHVAPLNGLKAGAAIDLMKGLRADCPLPPFGGAEQFNWSPDSREIAYTAKIVNNWAESTDSGVYLIDREGKTEARCITPGMKGYDTNPVYSPDGQFIAFQSMKRPSFESDRNRIMLFKRGDGSIREVTKNLDQTTHAVTWNDDSKSLYFVSEWRGTNQVFQLGINGGDLRQVTQGRFNYGISDLFADGSLLLTRMSMLRPTELVKQSSAAAPPQVLTDVNGSLYANLELPRIEERWVRASDGKQIHNWLILPPNFDPNKKWPVIVYCQGGPQGQIGQWFSYRWNFHLMASQGYVVIAVNRRGLPGFGRAWNDQISKDWGGQAMQDILASTDHMLAQPYVDRKRVSAVGASFGGYTVYWLMGNHQDRFSCMISHCGVFNLESMYGSTEELFFPNWDLGGPYWKSKELKASYDRFSPHRFIGNWKTPLLVIHGQKDFRVPVTQGMEAFTAAQVQGVPSRFLYFPQEGHWVLGPQNGVLWHRIFFDWLKRDGRLSPADRK